MTDVSDALLSVLTDARDLGLFGPGPLEAHITHARGFAQALFSTPSDAPASLDIATRPPQHVLDLGSGGGLPGLVLAEEWPATEMVLLDAGTRRAEFLHQAVERCGLGKRVTVVQGRAEAVGHLEEFRGAFDVVVARSFGRPAITAECAAPFLREGGFLVVSEPPEDEASDARWDPAGLDRLGLSVSRLIRGEFGYRIAQQARSCPAQFSRRDGVPAKRPLF